MIRYENDCVGCPDGVPCIGESCAYRNVPHIYCDMCGGETNENDYMHENGNDYCWDCADKLGLTDTEETETMQIILSCIRNREHVELRRCDIAVREFDHEALSDAIDTLEYRGYICRLKDNDLTITW